MSDDLQSRLASYYVRAFPAKQGVRVTALAHISYGWESDMYSFTVESGPAGAHQREDLILRIYSGDDAQAKSAREYRGMGLLHRAGYPVPQVLVLEREDSPFGRPFVVMERIQGRQLWPVWFGSPGEKQKEFLTLFCALFVQLHSLEWRPFAHVQHQPAGPHVAPHDMQDPYALVDRELGRMRPHLERFPVAGFLPNIEWLMERRDLVPCERPSVVHWDYHPANILLRDDGSAVVVDWTQVDVSDARFDLAWTLLLVSTYEDAVWHGRILREYERLASAQVEQLAFFEVFACLKRLYSVAASLRYGPETLGMRPGAETMMVQQMGALARVYNLLLDRTGLEVPEIEELLAQSS
jgi:aminoglycoside phosphotransferase (APT) family kinase protein